MDMGCIQNMKCNCDSRAITFDSGYLYGEDAGITRVVALHSEGDVNGRLTIGPLECKGFGGNGPIRFSKPQVLSIGYWRGEPLSLQFRTAVSSATVLSVQDGNGVVLRAELINGELMPTIFFNYNGPNYLNYSKFSHPGCVAEKIK
ncbi:hypothetical protein KIN20_012506 [Parelaphostrongylus tenuis]|uniref:Uncharacterized protein n=1 Tax=Parelaphostrongylus tenuis TaxID=148309 RepID=A0AAD5QQH7_PARTN|nr:hypothetical protein KIN20_012506 [Parelaphostrongylus tenuis]